jgi:hypothetical protein
MEWTESNFRISIIGFVNAGQSKMDQAEAQELLLFRDSLQEPQQSA